MTMTRREIEELLPFYANGTLEAEDRAAVEAALSDDPALRDELAALRVIRDTMQAEEVQSPGEFGLARLLREVEGTAQQGAPANLDSVPRARLRVWQMVAAVALAVGLGTGILGIQGPGEQPGEQPGFELASGDAEIAAAADFTVGFASEATEGEIRALLQSAGLEIVSGPTALGLYDLALLEGAEAEAALAALQAASVVETVAEVAP